MKALAVYTGAVLASGLWLWLWDVFTWAGFLTAFFVDDPGLWWPWGTRATWWVIFYGVGIAYVMRLLWREAHLECPTILDLWGAAHISLVHRAHRRLTWWFAGVKVAVAQHQAHRPTAVPTAVATVSTGPQDAVSTDREAAAA